jgi:DHA3 family tetracycline resistance protein-like MFS transporter
MGLLRGMVSTIYGLYAVKTAGLGPLELTLAGTCLELGVFLAEVPTGVFADAYGRRRSVIVGLCVVGTGIALMGAVPAFWCIALGSALWGVGGTFISGAHQAWLSDEIGEVRAAPMYMRGTQMGQVGSLLGIPLCVVLAGRHLALPLWVSGAAFWALAGFLVVAMSEAGYRPASASRRHGWQAMRGTLRAGIEIVRGRSALRTALVITLICGASSEAFGRLTPFHLLDDIGLPRAFDDATWFGILHAGSFLAGAVVTWFLGRTPTLHTPRRIVQTLLALTVAMTLTTLIFAMAGAFWVALTAAWVARGTRVAVRPLVMAWVNRGLAPGSRATVLSTLGQAEACGEITGAPLLGLVGTLHTVRAALVGAAVVLLPALPLCVHALRRDKERATTPASAS